MKKHEFILAPVDTDSISFCKPDMSEFTLEEQNDLLNEINNYMPELIKFDHDGYYNSVIVVKAKNYILYNEGKIKYKGSALTDQKKEPALIQMLQEMINVLLEIDTTNTLVDIYHKYIKESQNIKDIKRWSTKKTITGAIYDSERKNETKVLDAIQGEDVQQGDKVWIYAAIDGFNEELTKSGKSKSTPNKVLRLIKNWNGDEDKEHFLKRVHSTAMILKNIIDENTFVKYHIKKNKALLEELLK